MSFNQPEEGMNLLSAVRRPVKSRALVIAMLVIAATATAALAATFSGDGTFIGTSGNDTFNLGSGNDNAYGLFGKDTINAGNGNDVLDGDGQCMSGNNSAQYCQDGPISGDPGDTINAGNGNSTIFGGGGHNSINVGSGTDTIYGGPIGDTINTGANGHVTIFLGVGGGNTVTLGTMTGGVVYAKQGKADTINCNNASATIYADKGIDTLNKCKNVKYTSPSRDVARAKKHVKRHTRTWAHAR
jgi:Ca2+-binding RTX toxin-like protein